MTVSRLTRFSGLVALALLAVPSLAFAQGFTGPFAPANWTFVNDPADVAGSFTHDATTLVITGGDASFGGTSTITILAPEDGTVSFDWLYASLDDPGWDGGEWVLNGNPTLLSDTDGESGSESFNVIAGDVFGFQVFTFDGVFGAGNLTVDNFLFTAAAVPEPASMALIGLVVAGGGAAWYRRRKLNAKAANASFTKR